MFSNMPLAALLLPLPLLLVAVEATEYVVNGPQTSPFVQHQLAKRMDLEVCIGHFDVHKNTIIRTGESQAIGGKYLQGLELDTIEECERLCCETDACDVYIFERKAGGYCYLFECGPPENFHCKFTRHANYTSAVLTPQPQAVQSEVASTPRTQLPHIPSNNISQQEWELSNLKLKPEVRDKPTVSTASAVAAAAASVPSGVAQPAVAPVQSAPISSCGRFQFTCHSGECIAVYNACDGIPQCEDGSDEGPECITISSPVTKPPSSNPDLIKPLAPQQYLPATPIQQQLTVSARTLPQQQQQQQQHVIVLGPPPPPPPPPPMVNNREDAAAWANRKILVDGQQSLTQQQQQQIHLAQAQGEVLNNDEQSHIFSHKGGLQLQQVSSGLGQGVGPGQVQIQGHSAQLQLPGYDNNQAIAAGSVYGMSLPRSGMYLSPPQQQPQQLPSSSAQQQSAAWPQVQAQQPAPMAPQKQSQVYGSAPRMPVPQQAMLPVLNAAPTHGKNQGAGGADEDYDDYEEEKSTEAPKKKQRKHKKVKSKTAAKDPIELALEQTQQQPQQEVSALPVPVAPVHEQYKMIHENLALEFRDHDGHSERPGGAVLSLTFGLLVTAALAILIGCRMRTVGRRARRVGGKTPYSQEADFLVNGMYL
ncbi:low-density lipoprotein receptor-related protein 11 [Drosophila guanche]|uniref:Blast:Low-density lipoprotein receptor-related protein 11 n=1 Tax=Drosophila guanche TaxID=7266 RepID=A0A3B0K1K3_DROGU|nr:low-density lipoprotein receptor-related protein 11 [Drosophila guanche]SPP81750.1 blast:Low-density lipoprotein receptor-related protein 11 [Drosophila guanche]